MMLARSNRRKPDSTKPIQPECITFLSPLSKSLISPIELTRNHFLDAYSKGKWNLSKVPEPKCFDKVKFMKPPECYNELSRHKTVQDYCYSKVWEEKAIFKKLIGNIRKQFSVTGVSISVISSTKVFIKYESSLNMHEVPRFASIDSHSILSQDYFLLLDASKDWRTINNPFVTGISYIRFYCGVPLITVKREIIGVLAIFDPFTKKEFTVEQIKALKQFSQEIMKVLDSSEEELFRDYGQLITKAKNKCINGDDKSNELNELKLKLGRATSRGSLMTVFEKDGSGGPYSQNQSFSFLTKLNQQSMPQNVIDNNSLFDKLAKIGSIKKASTVLCKILSNCYKVDFVYILEIRVAESYQIENRYFPRENRVESDSFIHADKLLKEDTDLDNGFLSRIIGSYGSSHTSLNFENSIHQKSFETEFGIHYTNPQKDTLCNSGILMPFYRHNSKLVRQKKIRPGIKSDTQEKVKLFLRSGGYLIGLFNTKPEDTFDGETVSQIFGNVSVLRRLYIGG